MRWKEDSTLREQATRGWEPRPGDKRLGFSVNATEDEYTRSLIGLDNEELKAECFKLFVEIIRLQKKSNKRDIERATAGLDALYGRH